MKKKKLKVVYAFDPKITNWQEWLDSAFSLVFNKIYEMEMEKYGKQPK